MSYQETCLFQNFKWSFDFKHHLSSLDHCMYMRPSPFAKVKWVLFSFLHLQNIFSTMTFTGRPHCIF